MNELDKAHLQKRLSQLHEQRLKELSLEDDLGMETGYVTDSSINSRKGGEVKIEALPFDQTPINKSRKTKSERDKRRSSRVSLLDSKNDSGSENSSESATEEKQLRYRKRAGSKRIEAGSEVKESQDSRRKRAGSKNVNRLSITVPPPEDSEESALSDFQPTTLQMNRKDIYSGTWNPKERAVLDQVLNNMDVKSDPKKSFMGMFKRQRSTKQNNNNKEKNIGKIVEDTEEEHCTDSTGRDKYPLNQYYSDSERNVKKHNNKMGLFRKLKESVKQRHEEALLDRQLAHYMPSPSQKKKGIFSKFTASGKKKESGGRCRAHSSNDYARSVGVYIPPEEEKRVKETKPTNQENKSNLSKGKSGSFKNLFSSSRAKSVDNLNGAFEYYANPKQVFQRTPSMSKLNSRAASMEKIDQIKRSVSHKSLDHAFEPVQYTAKELCYEDPMVYAQTRFIQPQKANQRNTGHPHRQFSSEGYSSAYEDDVYRGYQSDVTPAIHMRQYAAPRFTFDHVPPHPHPSFTDQDRPHSAIPGGYYPAPHPRYAAGNFYATPQPYMNHAPAQMSPYFMPTHHAPPLPGYYTPGYATPGAMYPRSGYETPNGYTSESDYGYIQMSPHFIQRPPVAPSQRHSGYMAHQSRKAVQRSVSKNSSASGHSGNYGYASESSFCDDEIYSMVQPSSRSQQNTVPSTSCEPQRQQLTTDV